MALPTQYRGRYVYHFTHLKNLPSIFENGLLCTNRKNQDGISHKNVASAGIQHRRANMAVTCGPEGFVHDYVPFYFSTKNPMQLSIINSKNIDQMRMIILAIPIERLAECNVVFTDASANTEIPPIFFNDCADLYKLNWPIIDSLRWSFTDEERHHKMAEALFFNRVPIEWVTTLGIWNPYIENKVEAIYKSYGIPMPPVQYNAIGKGKYLWFTKFTVLNKNGSKRDNESLVTGPKVLYHNFKSVVKYCQDEVQKKDGFKFKDIDDALDNINADFCALEELEGIFELETINDVHSENVSDHTLQVVENLGSNKWFRKLSSHNKKLVTLSAYLHDIGKGPKWKWAIGKQPSYPDHPRDSLMMLPNILTKSIGGLSDDDIYIICMLVGYHDLLGDIVGHGRDISQLYKVVRDTEELNMLIAMSVADVTAINGLWEHNLRDAVPGIITDFENNLL